MVCAGLRVHHYFVIPPLHSNTSCIRFCIEGMRAAALGYRLATRWSFLQKTGKRVRLPLLLPQSLLHPAPHVLLWVQVR